MVTCAEPLNLIWGGLEDQIKTWPAAQLLTNQIVGRPLIYLQDLDRDKVRDNKAERMFL